MAATTKGMGSKTMTSPATLMTIPEMYKVATRSNQAWGVEGYEVPREYQDPRPNKLYEKKTVKDEDKKKMKKGDYLSYTLKMAATLPGPNAFQTPHNWVDEKIKNRPKIKYGDRTSYVADIFKEAKLRSVPGPGAYNLRKDPKEEEKLIKEKSKTVDKTKIPPRQNFLCEVEFVSDTTPGPGSYYPRLEVPKLKEAKPNLDDFRKRAKEKQKKSEKQVDGLHYNPHYATFDTFGKMSMDIAEKKNNRLKEKSLTRQKRFPDEKKAKEIGGQVPGPGHYQMIAFYSGKPLKGKKSDEDKKDKNWMNKITKGPTTSIYYS